MPQTIDDQLAALAAHLLERREAILTAWRGAAHRDPLLTVAATLPRTQLDDHIPAVLDVFGARLRLATSRDSALSVEATREKAEEHGLHRWQQGYHLREVAREWGHLDRAVMDEVEAFATQGNLVPTALFAVCRTWSSLVNEGTEQSTAKYFELQQSEAAGHVQELQRAVREVRRLESQTAELWRQAAHDLRGNVGMVVNATVGLTLPDMPESYRSALLPLLQRSVSSLHSMLDDVLEFSRLQAGHERRIVKSMDAGKLLADLVGNLQPLAAARGLYLRPDGPASLPLEGDPIKTRRIAQNLLLNALKYTERGGVTVSWGESRNNDPERWMLCVHDTGPGFGFAAEAVSTALQEGTAEMREVEALCGEGDGGQCPDDSTHGDPDHASPPGDHDLDPPGISAERGEGVGLSIVKRLCDLLDASLEIESTAAQGSTFRVIFPRRFQPNVLGK